MDAQPSHTKTHPELVQALKSGDYEKLDSLLKEDTVISVINDVVIEGVILNH
jgi:hypothetical protein